MATKNNEVSGWVGWIGFASFMMLFLGIFNVIESIADFSRTQVFVHSSGYVWILDYRKWAWINLIFGILLILGSGAVMRGGMGGRIFASFLAVLVAVSAVASIPIYPIWSIIVLIASVMVLIAVTAHGNEVKSLK